MGYDRSGRKAILVIHVSRSEHLSETGAQLTARSKRFEVDKLGELTLG